MDNDELISVLKIAAESVGDQNISLKMLLIMAADRIEELDLEMELEKI